MYVTSDKKVFLHMIKTGGISFHKSLQKADNVFLQYNMRHAHISMLPQKYAEYPRFIILRKPEDWYLSFYRFFADTQGFFSFILKDMVEEDGKEVEKLVNFDTFIYRAMNLKRFFIENPQKADIVNSIIQEQASMHFMMSFFTEVISEQNINNFDCTLFDFFWRGTGGETAQVIPMDENMDDLIENIFGFKMGERENITESRITLKKEEIAKETKAIIRVNHELYYYKLGLKDLVFEANDLIQTIIDEENQKKEITPSEVVKD